ncbi:MAG TPA: hypothetical protein VEJ63_21460, partial [Planctomycetota bacterium]|nr:hypothetical protein [Planctomycetota bacterium]
MIGRTPMLFGWKKLALLAVLLAGLGVSAHAADDNTAQIEKLFREGVDLYQRQVAALLHGASPPA